MPFPREELLKVWNRLPGSTVRAAAKHMGIKDQGLLSREELAERLANDELAFLSFLHHMVDSDLRVTAQVLGIKTDDKATRELNSATFNLVAGYDRRIQKQKLRKRAAKLPPMSADELIASASELARPALYLCNKVTATSTRAAVWSADREPTSEMRPWLAIDLRHHPEERMRREAVLILHADDWGDCMVELKTGHLPKPKQGEVGLYGTMHSELPPLEILFEKGNQRIQKWLDQLETHGWPKRRSPHLPNFPIPDARDGYYRHWRTAHPFFGNTVDAQLGGWPLTWAEQDATEQLQRTLVVRTYKSSDPWFEVFLDVDEFQVVSRIT